LVNCLRDNPMTQFSIQWILSPTVDCTPEVRHGN
jgi:hypothetical protein